MAALAGEEAAFDDAAAALVTAAAVGTGTGSGAQVASARLPALRTGSLPVAR